MFSALRVYLIVLFIAISIALEYRSFIVCRLLTVESSLPISVDDDVLSLELLRDTKKKFESFLGKKIDFFTPEEVLLGHSMSEGDLVIDFIDSTTIVQARDIGRRFTLSGHINFMTNELADVKSELRELKQSLKFNSAEGVLCQVIDKIYSLILDQLKEKDSAKYEPFNTLSAVLSSKIWMKAEMVSAIMAITDKTDEVEAAKLWECLRTVKKSRNENQHSSSNSRTEVLDALDTYVSLWNTYGRKPTNSNLYMNALRDFPTVFALNMKVLVDKHKIYDEDDEY